MLVTESPQKCKIPSVLFLVFSLCAVMTMHVLRKRSWFCSENSLFYTLYMIGESSCTFSLFSFTHSLLNYSSKSLRRQSMKKKSTWIPWDFHFVLLFSKKVLKWYLHQGLWKGTVEYVICDPGKIQMCLSAGATDFKNTATRNKCSGWSLMVWMQKRRFYEQKLGFSPLPTYSFLFPWFIPLSFFFPLFLTLWCLLVETCNS